MSKFIFTDCCQKATPVNANGICPLCNQACGYLDAYDNPVENDGSGDELIYCCFPDCGCDGARLCMAREGASEFACGSNVEGMWSGKTREQCQGVFKLLEKLNDEKNPQP